MGNEAKQAAYTGPGSGPAGLSTLVRYGGDAARMRQAQYQRAKMQGLGPLWKHSEEFVDDIITRIGREGLVIADDRIQMNPVSMPNWLGIPELTSHKVSESRHADRGMVPGSRGEVGIQDKTPYTVPIYVTWDEFSFNVRELAAAERTGRPLETDEAEQAVRNVNYAIEDAIITGGPTVGGNASQGLEATTTIRQYQNSGRTWDDSSKDGSQIQGDVLLMRSDLASNKFYGPYTLYVSTAYGAVLQEQWSDGTTTLDKTIQEVLESMEFGGRNLRIRQADLLSDDVTYLVDDSSRAIDVIVGQQPMTIMPAPEHEWHQKFTTFACIVPRVKSNYDGNFGICEGNTTGS